jgi:hypothetical protein
MKCARVLAVLSSIFALSLRGDTIELKTGERIEGTFKQATSAGAVIEVGGQSITIPLEKVQAIHFGAVPARTVAGPALSELAIDALKALRSVTESGISYRDYAPRVLDTRVKVDKYLSSPANDAKALQKAIETAMREYELAGQSWNRQGDLSRWSNLDPDLLKTCPAVGKVAENMKLATSFQVLGMVEEAEKRVTVDGQSAPVALWKCASAQVAEAERSLAQH